MSAVDYFNGVIVGSSSGTTILSFSDIIPAGSLSAVVSHNLGVTPSGYFVTPTNDYAALGGLSVSDINSSTVTVSIVNSQGADASFKVGVSA